MDSPTPPPAPDPNQVASTSQQYNTNAATASQAGSMVNQENPSGSLTYNQTGTGPNGTPLYTATTQLDPTTQYLFDALNSNKVQAGNWFSGLMGNANNNFNTAGATIGGANDLLKVGKGALDFGNYDTTDARAAVGDATSGITKRMLDQKTAYLNPYFDTAVNQLDAKLRNQGLSPNEPAYAQAMDALKQSQNKSVTDFLASAEPQAFQEAQQSYAMPLTIASGIGNMVPNWLAPAAASTNLGNSQLGGAATMLGASAPTMPTWAQTPGLNISPANYQGAVNASTDQANKNYQAELANKQNMMSGLFGVPTALLGGWAKNGGVNSLMSGVAGMF